MLIEEKMKHTLKKVFDVTNDTCTLCRFLNTSVELDVASL
jgi:hypothetical protein